MERHFFQELDSLKGNIIKMASLVDNQVEDAFTALETSNIELCKSVKRKDIEIDAYDNLIRAQTENILALYQPVATDLRFIITAMMVNNQLERCGDIAVNVAQRVKKTVDSKEMIIQSQILEMGKIAKTMVKDSIDSFINSDAKLARSVLEKDDLVDNLNKEIFDFLINKMESGKEFVRTGSHLLILSRHVERLADHATNIAEDVVFLVDAEIISHRRKLLQNGEKN